MMIFSDDSSPSYLAMTQRDEKRLVDARKAFYDNAKIKEVMLRWGEIAGKLID